MHQLVKYKNLNEQNKPANLHELFKQGANKDLDKIALIQDEKKMTFRELDELSSEMASVLLTDYDIKKGSRVIAYMANSIEYCSFILACMKLGAIVVPINIRLNMKEVKYILSDAKPSLIIADANLINDGKFSDKYPILDIEKLCNVTPEKNIFNKHDIQIDELDPAFLIYTSGTTGLPKGALLHHKGIVHTVLSYELFFQTDEKSKTIIAVPLFHVTGLIGQFLHMLYLGGSSVILKRYQTSRYIEVLQDERVNFLFNVPTIYTMLISTFEKNHNTPFLNVTTIASGGAPLSSILYESLIKYFPNAFIQNCYGATETSSPATIMPREYPDTKNTSVGIPIPQTEVKVVDEQGNDLGRDEVGELLIKGPMVINEYWEDPEANETNFTNNYWYSGDYASIDEDGYVYILDRKNDVIIRGGENIYSIEIENTLNEHVNVIESAVVGIPDDIFGEVVKAFVTVNQTDLTEDQLKQFASQYLADYKVPYEIEFVDKLPKNSAGKIMKHKLTEK